MKRNKRYLVMGISLLLVIVCISCIYAFTRPKKVILVLKDNMQEKLIEYGETLEPKIEDYLDLSNLSQKEKDEVLKLSTINYDIKNEEGKGYPAVGEYPITIQYKEETIKSQLIVKDSIAPVFNEIKSVEWIVGEQFDYNQYIKVTDLSLTSIEYQTDQVNLKKTGNYKVQMKAIDAYDNQTIKELSVKIIAKPTSEQVTKVVVDKKKGAVSVQVTQKEVKQEPVKTTDVQKTESKPSQPAKPTKPSQPVKPSQPTSPKEIIELKVPYIN